MGFEINFRFQCLSPRYHNKTPPCMVICPKTSVVYAILIYVLTIVYDFCRLIVTLQVDHQKQLHAKSLKQEVSPAVVKDIECCEFHFVQTVIVSLTVNGYSLQGYLKSAKKWYHSIMVLWPYYVITGDSRYLELEGTL